jgi:hypothetical protein
MPEYAEHGEYGCLFDKESTTCGDPQGETGLTTGTLIDKDADWGRALSARARVGAPAPSERDRPSSLIVRNSREATDNRRSHRHASVEPVIVARTQPRGGSEVKDRKALPPPKKGRTGFVIDED